VTAGPGAGAEPGPAPGTAANGSVRTIFFGSGPFAVPILEAVAADARLRLVAIVTGPDRPAGRGQAVRRTPVAERAAAFDVPLLQPARLRTPEAITDVQRRRPELGILADYGQIVPREILELPALGILNIHPSLLPRHRGAAPIQATIAEGDSRAGVSIIEMDEGVDTGPMVAGTEWALTGRERAPELEARAARVGAELLTRVLGSWLDRSAIVEPQEAARASATRPLRREDGRLDPGRSADELERRVRAYDPWPGAFFEIDEGRVLVHEASVAPSGPGDVPGQLIEHDRRLALSTHHGRLVFEAAQGEGRGAASGEDFLRGHRRLVGKRVKAPLPGGGR
jgi:methionyl-tRNA formyltransferase